MYIYLLHGVIAIAIENQCFLSYFEWCIFNWFMDWTFMSQKMSCNIGAQILTQSSNLFLHFIKLSLTYNCHCNYRAQCQSLIQTPVYVSSLLSVIFLYALILYVIQIYYIVCENVLLCLIIP